MSVRRLATLPNDGGATLTSRLDTLLRLGQERAAVPLSRSPSDTGVAADADDGATRRLSTLTYPTSQVEKVLQDKIRALEASLEERNSALSRALVELADVSKRARACAARSAELSTKRADDAIEQQEYEEENARLRDQIEWLQERCDYVYGPSEPPSLDTEPYGRAEPDPEREAAERRVREGRDRREARALRQRRMEERNPLMDGIDYPPSIGASALRDPAYGCVAAEY